MPSKNRTRQESQMVIFAEFFSSNTGDTLLCSRLYQLTIVVSFLVLMHLMTYLSFGYLFAVDYEDTLIGDFNFSSI